MLWQRKRYEKKEFSVCFDKEWETKIIFCLAQSSAVPHNQFFVPYNLTPKSRPILTFFPHPVRRPVFDFRNN